MERPLARENEGYGYAASIVGSKPSTLRDAEVMEDDYLRKARLGTYPQWNRCSAPARSAMCDCVR